MAGHRPLTAGDLLARARAGLERLDPLQAREAMARGAVLVDVRSEAQRSRDGVVPGSVFHPRNVLEWRLDPAGRHRDRAIARRDAHIIVMCAEGYQSSLAAANLQAMGIARATDLRGGFAAWRAAGLPVEPAP